MPYKITSGVPGKKLKADLLKLIELPEDEMKRLIHWLTSGENLLPITPKEFARMTEVVGGDGRELNEVFALLRYVMVSWRRNKLTLDDILSDLESIGFSEAQVQTAKGLFSSLEVTKEQFFAAAMRRTVERSGLPSLDDLTFHWDLRPIFASAAYPIVDGDEENVAEWLSHAYLCIFELDYSSSNDDSKSISLQLTESDFMDLEKALLRARKQLETLKNKRLL